MKPRLIVIDGKTYNSIDEMPAEIRSQYEKALRTLKDQDGNRVPDILEENNRSTVLNRDESPGSFDRSASTEFSSSSIKVLVDGKEYNSIEDLPADVRAKYDQAMGGLDANQNGIPDFIEGIPGIKQDSSPASSLSSDFPKHVHVPIQTSPIGTPDTSNGWMLVLAGALLLFFCAAAVFGVWYFFIR